MKIIKTIVLASVLICAGLVTNAQGLVFEGADVLEISQAGSNAIYAQTDLVVTVPAGKVWKIENAGVSRIFNSSSGGTAYTETENRGSLLLNGVIICGIGTTNDFISQAFPLWLPAGTYTFTLEGDTFQDSRFDFKALISLLIFNVS